MEEQRTGNSGAEDRKRGIEQQKGDTGTVDRQDTEYGRQGAIADEIQGTET
jgi:hypothetical protein